MNLKIKSFLAGMEGFDADGNPIDIDSGRQSDGSEPTTKSLEDIDTNVRVVADQPVVDQEPLPQEERTANEEIVQETVAIEELEQRVDSEMKQQENIEGVSDQLEDTINDVRPAIEEGGVATEALNMIHSLRKRINDKHGVLIGGESFDVRFATESFGLTKSTRLSNSKNMLNILAQEAVGVTKSLKNVAVAIAKSVIDLLNRIVNFVDAQGRRAKSLKERLGKLQNYNVGVEFESAKIANGLVKNTNGESYKPTEFANKLSQYSMDTTAVTGAVAKVTAGVQPLVGKIQEAAKSNDSKGTLTGAKDAIKEFFARSWKSVTGPRMAKGETFVGVVVEGGDLKNVTKETVAAKDIKFKTPALSELQSIIESAIKASESIKKARSEYGNIFSAKAKLGDEADRIVASLPKDATEELKSATRQAASQLVRDGREELNALKHLTKACSDGVGILINYVDLCASKGTKKVKDDTNK